MNVTDLIAYKQYGRHLSETMEWIVRSVQHGRGGSSAYYAPVRGWALPYPETTGYMIPTLLNAAKWTKGIPTTKVALSLGEWLLSIQQPDGYWFGGVHRIGEPGEPSVFNTGQILKGMVGLYRATGDLRWFDAALAGARWLAIGVGPDGWWKTGHYRGGFSPSYYTQVAWPMLEVWKENGDEPVRTAAVSVLKAALARRKANDVVSGWGFDQSAPAFTHTIAYTLRGLLEAARLLEDWETFAAPVVPALEKLARKAELAGGNLPGEFDEEWKVTGSYVCLTGNAQVALCLLILEERTRDLRLVNAAAKLVDTVCAAQNITSPVRGIRGAVAGSAPLWGRYMRFRYPNWAAKYHADALMRLLARLQEE